MRCTVLLACLLSCLSIQTARGQDPNPLDASQSAEDERLDRIRLRILNDDQPTCHRFLSDRCLYEVEWTDDSSEPSPPYISWLTTDWLAFGTELDHPIGQSLAQPEPLQDRTISNDRLLEKKLAERDKLLEEIERLRKITGRPEQVMLHVTILEASPDVVKELGLRHASGSANQPSDKGTDVPPKGGSLAQRIEKARRDKRLKILAQPSLVATTGRPATLKSGGEFPLFLPKPGGKDGIEWREFGTRLEVVTANLGNGRLRLEISTEISALDTANSVTVAGQTVPGLTTRRSNSQLDVEIGQTVVLGGMISTRGDEAIELVTLVRCELVDGPRAEVPAVEQEVP